MSPIGGSGTCGEGSFPRVSGDEPATGGGVFYETGFSPRERG